jgi:superfamily II DNA or RNA helicase
MMLALDEKRYIPQTLREYQEGAVDAICDAWAQDETPLAALATGAGKTTILAELLVRSVNPATQRALVIAHTTEIIHQLYERIQNQFGGVLEQLYGLHMQPGIGMVMAEKDSPDARIVVATRQSLHKRRMERLLKTQPFDVVLVDEAHHALQDNTYGTIIEACKAANPAVKIAGFTATPSRSDRKALASLFTTICYEWLIPEGIAGGYLVPTTRMKVATRVDVSKIKSSHGDYDQNRLISALDASNWLELCVDAYMQYVAPTDRLTLAFMPSVAMSRTFAEALAAQGIPAAHIDGETPKDERRAILGNYSAGRLRVVSNMAVLTEGFDAPITSAIFLGRPTRSKSLFTQIVGRGLRPFPGKHDCLLLDMTVVDTKALEIGTLLGRLHKCKVCSVEYYSSLPKCPQCGAPKTITDRDVIRAAGGGNGFAVEKRTGTGLVTNYEPLFERAFAAWYHGADGFLSCTVSFEHGAYIIIPPLEDNYYRLVHVPKFRTQPIEFINRNEDLSALMMDADALIQNQAQAGQSDKNAPWREHPISPAQQTKLKGLGVDAPSTMSKGAASQLLTHLYAVKRLMEDVS